MVIINQHAIELGKIKFDGLLVDCDIDDITKSPFRLSLTFLLDNADLRDWQAFVVTAKEKALKLDVISKGMDFTLTAKEKD